MILARNTKNEKLLVMAENVDFQLPFALMSPPVYFFLNYVKGKGPSTLTTAKKLVYQLYYT